MNLLQVSISGSIAILIICIIRRLFLFELPKKYFITLWYMVLFRMLFPYSIRLNINQYLFEIPNNSIFTNFANTLTKLPTNVEISEFKELFQGIWITGICILLTYFMLIYIRFYKRFFESSTIENTFILNWKRRHLLKREIVVCESNLINTPLSYGVFKPKILLPESWKEYSKKELRYILEHEFIHIKRWDSVLKMVMVVVLCIYWFNPLVWIMFFLLNQDIELTCDEVVLELFGEEKRGDYARVLISFEEQKITKAVISNGFSEKAIKERVIGIMKYKNITAKRLGILISIIIVILLSYVITDGLVNKSTFPNKEVVLISGYPKNKNGETYGPDIEGMEEPDLILTEGNNQIIGYVKKEELFNQQKNPDKGIINLYLEDGETIIGSFSLD